MGHGSALGRQEVLIYADGGQVLGLFFEDDHAHRWWVQSSPTINVGEGCQGTEAER